MIAVKKDFFYNTNKSGRFKKSLQKIYKLYKKDRKGFFTIFSIAFATILLLITFLVIFPKGSERKISLSDHVDVGIDQFLSDYFQSDYTGVGSGTISEENNSFIVGLTVTHYTIQEGDTLGKIARNNKISLGTLISYNNIKNVRRLIPGKDLIVPNLEGVLHKVKKGDSIEKIAKKYGVSVNKILDGNNLDSDVLTVGEKIFIPGGKLSEYELKSAIGNLVLWPCSGRITSWYGGRNDPFTGRRRFHNGLDIANYKGAPIKAAMSGKVVLVESSKSGYGKYIVIKHSNGFSTLYGHLLKQYVVVGQWVEQGQTIGGMGSTGRSTGTHCHFTMYKNGSSVNPMLYLSGRP